MDLCFFVFMSLFFQIQQKNFIRHNSLIEIDVEGSP